MISDAEIAAARAVPISQVVGSVVQLKRDYGLCVFHDERSPSLHIHRASNTFICFGCGAKGDTIEFIRRYKRLDFQSAIRELSSDWLANGLARASGEVRKKASRETEVPSLVSELWGSADAPRLATFYLSSRGIEQKALPAALRGHRRVWCAEADEFRPAMIAAISDAQGRVTALQRIYLSASLEYDGKTVFEKGTRAADLTAPKKTIGPMGTGAVRLAAAGEIVGLAESVETALAAAKLYRLPVWAVCGATRLGNVELPAATRHVVIFGDNDKSGRAEAAKAEAAYQRRGYGTQSEFPESKDFAEQLA